MNTVVTPEDVKPSKPVAPLGKAVKGRDREFLPAALEILETPPAPAPVFLMLTLCAFVVAALAWAYVGRLDVHAVARGKIVSIGYSKVIQPLEPGRVAQVAVVSGQRVKAGDLLVAFETADIEADLRIVSDIHAAAVAEMARRDAGILAARAAEDEVSPSQSIAFAADVSPVVRDRETKALAEDLRFLADTVEGIKRQIAQREAAAERLKAQIAEEMQLLDTLEERVTMRSDLVKQDAGPRANLLDAREALQRAQATLASDKGQLVENEAAIAELRGRIRTTTSQFASDYQARRGEADRKAQEAEQQLIKAKARLTRAKLVAPIDGTVQDLAVTTVGQVVTTGQLLMTLVPSDTPIEAEVLVRNTDIGFVSVGQEVAIKVDAFPFTRYGTVKGRVSRIAADAIDEQDARRVQANAISLANGSASNTPTGAEQNFVFIVGVSLDKRTMAIDGATVSLTPGMTVTAEVKTDQRRVIDYLFSPLAIVASESMRER